MKVTHVAICPTEASSQAGRPALTPELLAASGARYSRNNEGLESILAKIDPDNLDKSVDGIFRMIDYGHQSIADMAPVALFMDGLSLWLAYYIWTLSPTAGGQESSTRYINYSAGSDESTLNEQATRYGIPETLRDEWKAQVQTSFAAYEKALQIWSELAERDPDVARIPLSLQEDTSEKAQKQVARMRRNYAFDRARNFLPSCAPTNVMMVMSARGWVNLCQHLLSHPNAEAQQLGTLVREELAFSAPRLLKHAVTKASIEHGLRDEFHAIQRLAAFPIKYLQPNSVVHEHPPGAFLEMFPSRDFVPPQFTHDLQYHDNRYAWLGPQLRRSAIRFGWDAVAFAEIRDLNRHRTGTKWCPFVPQGFYAALDQIPVDATTEIKDQLHAQSTLGRNGAARARQLLASGDMTYVYWTTLGTQVPFEHTTTADKFLYEAELRTGTGAHFRYASHLRDVLALWYEQFPDTRDLVLEGSAEPE
jgi:thymidylate synthase ThyX